VFLLAETFAVDPETAPVSWRLAVNRKHRLTEVHLENGR